MFLKTLSNLDVTSKTVLLRVDFNVPLTKDGEIADESRILAHLDTIMELIEKGAKLILCSHMGKKEHSLKVVADYLETVIPCPVTFVPDCLSPQLGLLKMTLQEGEVVLLENTRMYPEEEKNDPAFAQSLAEGIDVFVNDAFATAHRKHASTAGVAEHVAEKGIGRLMEKEVYTLQKLLESPKKPFLVIIGGSKISSKLGVFRNLIHKSDQILIGGAMANTFLKSLGHEVGKSLYEEDMVQTATEILQEAALSGCRISLPKDLILAEDLSGKVPTSTAHIGQIPTNMMALDIGPETRKRWANFIAKAGTILWNGPVGAFEIEPFNEGTINILTSLSTATAFTIAGGGDTLSAINDHPASAEIDYISTAGGAMLSFLEGKELPALKALEI